MKWKRSLTLLAALAVLAGMAAGCSGSKEPVDSSGASEDTSATTEASGEMTTEASAEATQGTSGENTTETRTESTKKTSASTKSDKVDLKGYKFVIAECHYDKYEGIKRGESEMGDAILDRNARIEKELNCKITYDNYNALTFYEQAYSAIMAGDPVADIMVPSLFNFGKLVNSDSLYDISSLPGINLSASCWSKYFEEAAKTSKGTLGVSATLANPLAGAYGVYFNKNLAKELGLGDLYKMVRDGTWTWDTFSDLMAKAAKDVNGDGKFDDNDRWACSGSGFDAIMAFFLSSGQKVFVNDGSKVKYNLANKAAYDKINKMNLMFVNLQGAFYNPSQDFEKMQQNFWKGNVLFFIFPIVPGDKYRNMKDDYGLLPLPKGPGQSNYVTPFDHNSTIICVPATVKNKEATGTILQKLAEESKKEESVFFSELENLRYRDAESLEMVKKYIIPSARADISTMYHSVTAELALAVDSAICNTIMRDRNFDPTTFIEGIKDLAQSQIDDICNK